MGACRGLRASVSERLSLSGGTIFPGIRVAARRRRAVVHGAAMGTRKVPVLDPEATAGKVARMALARAAAHEERLVAQAKLLTEYTAMDLDELRRPATTRQWLAACMEASGATGPEIGRMLGLKGGKVSAHRLKQHPIVRRLVQLIQDHQLALVLRGEYGAINQARAAATGIVQNLTELAGATAPDATGTRAGRAKRDADSIRAGEVVLNVAGLQRQQHYHVHEVLFAQMDDGELETFANTGAWPDRLAEAAPPGGGFTALPAPSGPDVNGPRARANDRPRERGPGPGK